MSLVRTQRGRLPKAPLLWFRWHWSRKAKPRVWWAKFRNANAMFIWLGPLELGWRMPWLESAARQLHPEAFTGAEDGR